MGYGETRGMGNRLQWRTTVDGVDGEEEVVDGISTDERTPPSGFRGKGRRVDGFQANQDGRLDRITVRKMGQGVYLSTEMAGEPVREGIQVVDRASTEGLRVDGVSTGEVVPDDEAVDGEEGERRLRVGDICRYVGSGLKMLKGLNQIRIEVIEEEMAVVKGIGWYVTQQVFLRDLRRISLST